jgi:hypothetical protein
VTDAKTWAEGDLVRVRGWSNAVFRIKNIHTVTGEVTLWGGTPGRLSMRTVESTDRLLPAKYGDATRLR